MAGRDYFQLSIPKSFGSTLEEYLDKVEKSDKFQRVKKNRIEKNNSIRKKGFKSLKIRFAIAYTLSRIKEDEKKSRNAKKTKT